jgi:hypothetical protein
MPGDTICVKLIVHLPGNGIFIELNLPGNIIRVKLNLPDNNIAYYCELGECLLNTGIQFVGCLCNFLTATGHVNIKHS